MEMSVGTVRCLTNPFGSFRVTARANMERTNLRIEMPLASAILPGMNWQQGRLPTVVPASMASSGHRSRLLALFCLLTIAAGLSSGCARLKQYSLDSYQGPLPMEDNEIPAKRVVVRPGPPRRLRFAQARRSLRAFIFVDAHGCGAEKLWTIGAVCACLHQAHAQTPFCAFSSYSMPPSQCRH